MEQRMEHDYSMDAGGHGDAEAPPAGASPDAKSEIRHRHTLTSLLLTTAVVGTLATVFFPTLVGKNAHERDTEPGAAMQDVSPYSPVHKEHPQFHRRTPSPNTILIACAPHAS